MKDWNELSEEEKNEEMDHPYYIMAKEYIKETDFTKYTFLAIENRIEEICYLCSLQCGEQISKYCTDGSIPTRDKNSSMLRELEFSYIRNYMDGIEL